MPFRSWRHKHAVHHATAGDLDRRGVGDIQTLTVAEYQAQPWLGRLGYRLFRNPLVMFGLGPLVGACSSDRGSSRPRQTSGSATACSAPISRSRSSAVAFCWLIGWQRVPARCRARRCCSPARSASGCSTSSTSSKSAYWESARELELRRRRTAGQLLPQAAAGPAVLHRQHRLPPRPPSERADPELQPADCA